MNLRDLLIGAAFAGAVALLAWRGHALTRSGALAAWAVGALTYAGGTLGFTLVLLAFFVPSLALSRLGRARKQALVDIGKGGARDGLQVLANGGIATACAIGYALSHDIRWAVGFAGAYAAATADTWATEIGTLAGHPPRSILGLRPVATGLSGGITWPGTLAQIAGALWIGAVAPLAILVTAMMAQGGLSWPTGSPSVFTIGVAEFAIVPLAGIVGATADSLLGATVQELRRCDACDRPCETDPHACGNPTRLIRGVRGVSNDVVNLLATAIGAAVALALAAAGV